MEGPGPAHKQLLESQKRAVCAACGLKPVEVCACPVEGVGLTDLVVEVVDAVKALQNCCDYDSATAYDLERASHALLEASGRLHAEQLKIANARLAIAMFRKAGDNG
jgi:hypothetical protein